MPIESMTLSDGHDPGERAPSRAAESSNKAGGLTQERAVGADSSSGEALHHGRQRVQVVDEE
jgi:hypothetical protein